MFWASKSTPERLPDGQPRRPSSHFQKASMEEEVEEEEEEMVRERKERADGSNKRAEEEVVAERKEPAGWADRGDEDGDEDDDKNVGDHKSAHEGG